MPDNGNILDSDTTASSGEEDWEVVLGTNECEETQAIGDSERGKQSRNGTVASLDFSVLSMDSKLESILDDNDQHSVSSHRETLADLEEVGWDKPSVAVSPLVQPLVRQTSTESTSSLNYGPAGFDTEWNVKLRRGESFNKPNLCQGKTRRRKCHCRSCKSRSRGIVETSMSYADTWMGYEATGPRQFPITEFDLLGLPQSMDKSENWELMRDALSGVATSRTEKKSKTSRNDLRRVEVFDVEIIGSIVTPQAQFRHQHEMATRANGRAWKSFREGTYYAVRERLRHLSFTAQDTMDFYHAVRAIKVSEPVQLQPDEVHIHARPTFYSGRTDQALHCSLGSGSMISRSSVRDEIANICRRTSWTSLTARSEGNRLMCWASEPHDDVEYDDWYLELDFGQECHATALIIQGRAPEIEQFPHAHLFESTTECQMYKGPIWPVVVPGTDGEWVKRVAISARSERGEWFRLGQFHANDDCFSEVRIDLPLSPQQWIRYLRIQPLSKLKGGFHGHAPAMRCGVVGYNEGGPAFRAARGARESEVPQGFIRYEVKVPDPAVEGVRADAKYVAGRAIDYCSMSKWYREKSDGSRFQKKKGWHAMLLDSDTYVG